MGIKDGRKPAREPLARDVMRSQVVVVPADADLWEVCRLLTVNSITGAPVVDADGKVVGVVSQTDIIAHLQRTGVWGFQLVDFYSDPEAAAAATARAARARDLMTSRLIHADEKTPVSQLRRLMLENRIHRVLILDEGRLAGIVTTMDLLRSP